MRIEEVVAWQIRQRRDGQGLSQSQLGEQLAKLLGREWPRQAVSAAERGKRSFTAAELVAIAAALRTTVGDLLKPPLHESAVELGGAEPVPKDALLAVIASRLPEDLNFPAIQETLTRLADTANRGQEDIAQVIELAEKLDRQITERVKDGGVWRAPLAGPGVDPSGPHYTDRTAQEGDG